METADERAASAESGAMPNSCCCGDPYAGLPPEVRPRPVEKDAALRQATCPICGLVYWTNRETDVCIRCGSL